MGAPQILEGTPCVVTGVQGAAATPTVSLDMWINDFP